MDSLNKYITIGLVVIVLALSFYCMSVRNSRNEALHKVDNLNVQLDIALDANKALTNSICSLEKEQKKNRAYITQLEEQKAKTSKRAMEELERFKNAKKTNPPINSWADSKLPNGLY